MSRGAITTYVFDGTRWQISNFLGTGGTGGGANTFLVKIPYVVDTSGVPNTVVANFSPAITALNAGDPIMVKIANTNTLPTQITVNALPAKAIVRNDGNLTPLQQSDLPAGAIVFLLFDGTQFLIIAGACNFGVPSKILEFMSTQNWTVPNGVYRVRAKVWGGGGGGGGSQSGRPGSGGGGGGGYAERICQVAPGLVIAITVGARRWAGLGCRQAECWNIIIWRILQRDRRSMRGGLGLLHRPGWRQPRHWQRRRHKHDWWFRNVSADDDKPATGRRWRRRRCGRHRRRCKHRVSIWIANRSHSRRRW